jgi:putative nucleotidyltransferase-like protein
VKDEVIRTVLRAFSNFKPGFCLKGRDLVVFDRKRALDLLRHHSLDLLALSACNLENEFKAEISKTHFDECVYQVNLLKELEKVAEIFSENKIIIFLTKGFALRRYYPSGCVRPMSDIDLLIRPEDRLGSVEVLRREGYRLAKEEDLKRQLDVHGELVWHNPENNMKVEVHWDLINAKSAKKAANFDSDIVFREVRELEIEGVKVNTLSPQLELAHLMIHHVLHHNFKRLLWLVDVLLVLRSREVDMEKFEKCVKQLRIERPVHYYLRCLHKIFPEMMTEDLNKIKKRLKPWSLRYNVFAGINRPERIFRKGVVAAKLKDKLFRNAFK